MTVLTSSARLARQLRWRLGQQRRTAGAGAWPDPDIQTLNQWLESLWERSVLTDGQVGQRLLLSDAQLRHCTQKIIADLSVGRQLGSGVDRLVREARQICMNWRIGADDLQAAATGPDSQFFADWAEQFRAACAEHGWIDSAALSSALIPELEALLKITDRQIVLAGFTAPSAAEQQLFEELDRLGRLAGALRIPVATAPHLSRTCFADQDDERRAVAAWARERLQAEPEALLGVIVPGLAQQSAAFRREFLDAFDPLWRERDAALYPVTINTGTRLFETGLFRAASLLLRVPQGRMDFRELGYLLRSPFVGDWQSEVDARSQFDLRIRDDGLQTINLRTLRRRFCAAAEGPEKFLTLLDNQLALTEQTQGRAEPSEWAGIFDQILVAGGFCHGRALMRREEQLFTQWERLLDGFASLDEFTGPVGYRQALQLLNSAAREQTVSPPGRDDGVQVLAPAEAQGMSFDAVWICGMSSVAWGEPARPSALIPLQLQRERGIPEAMPDLHRQRAVARFDDVVASAAEVMVSWHAAADEEELLPSPMIESFALVEPEQVVSAYQAAECVPQPVLLERVADLPPPVGEGEAVRGGSRLLTLQSVCPARAFFELRLGAKEMPVPPFALDAMTRGSLVHDAAEFFYTELGPEPLQSDERQIDRALTKAIERSLDRHIAPMHPLAEPLRESETPRLKRLLQVLLDSDQQRGALRIGDLESRQNLVIDRATLRVRYDRIDVDAEGGRLVIDYKTGAKYSASHWYGSRPLEMQMPLYAAFGDFDGIALYWLQAAKLSVTGISDREWGLAGNRSFAVVDRDAWLQQVAQWRDVCHALLQEFLAGDCRIDLANDRHASGEYAALTRRWSLDASLPEELP